MTTLEKMGAAAKQAAREAGGCRKSEKMQRWRQLRLLWNHTQKQFWLQTRRTFPQQKKMGCPVVPFEFEIDKGSLLHLKQVFENLQEEERGGDINA